MKKWAWVLGLTLTASWAGAQSSAQLDQSRLKNAGPRDSATGQASGKRDSVQSPRDAATGQASGKRVHSPTESGTGQASGVSVAAGDVDGDGRAEAAAVKKGHYDVKKQEGAVTDCKASATGDTKDCDDTDTAATERRATKSRSNVQNNREAGSGIATGKRQH